MDDRERCRGQRGHGAGGGADFLAVTSRPIAEKEAGPQQIWESLRWERGAKPPYAENPNCTAYQNRIELVGHSGEIHTHTYARILGFGFTVWCISNTIKGVRVVVTRARVRGWVNATVLDKEKNDCKLFC